MIFFPPHEQACVGTGMLLILVTSIMYRILHLPEECIEGFQGCGGQGVSTRCKRSSSDSVGAGGAR